jgi:hypothetical protein
MNLEGFKMNIIIKESHYNLLVEQVGLDEFMSIMDQTFPDSVYAMDTIAKFIRQSGCQKIELINFKYPALGAALHDRVILNNQLLKYNFTFFLYAVFHEIAHQYQYKKYGIDKMYGAYVGEIPVEEAAKFMKYVENVADEFAIRKLREIDKLHGQQIKLNVKSIKKNYENTPVSQFENLIKSFIKIIKDANITNKEDISEILYNHVKK